MTKKVFLLLFVATFAVSIFHVRTLQIDSNHHNRYNILMIENVEALAEETEESAGYKIEPYDCIITGFAQVKLGNGKIIKATADGKITISGAQNCKIDGEYLCKTITCDQLYSVIF